MKISLQISTVLFVLAFGTVQAQDVTFEERLLWTVPDHLKAQFELGDNWQIRISPDGRHVTYYDTKDVQHPLKGTLFVDGRKMEGADGVGKPVFSPEGRIAYAAQKDGKSFVVVDEKKGEEFDSIDFGPVYWPARKAFVYQATSGAKRYYVEGEKKVDNATIPQRMTFSSDPKSFAYIVGVKGGRQRVYFGTRKGEVFEQIDNLVLSPDGTTIAYIGRTVAGIDDRYVLVVGERKIDEYEFVSDLVFSPDGKTLAYAATKDNKSFIVVGEKKGSTYFAVREPVFSPDGKVVAYPAREGDDWFVVTGDKPGEKFAEVSRPIFRPNGSVAYLARDKSGKWRAVVGDKKGPEFEGTILEPLAVSADGLRLACGLQKGREIRWKISMLGEAPKAEDVFRTVEKKFKEAPAVAWLLESEILMKNGGQESKVKARGNLRVKAGNKCRYTITLTRDGKSEELVSLSDGKTTRNFADGKWDKAVPVQEGITEFMRESMLRAGFMTTVLGTTLAGVDTGKAIPKPDEAVALSGFASPEWDLLEYQVKLFGKIDGRVKLRLKDGMPVKCEFSSNDGNFRVTESYQKIWLDDIPDSMFEKYP